MRCRIFWYNIKQKYTYLNSSYHLTTDKKYCHMITKSPLSAYQKDLSSLTFSPKNADGHLYDAVILGGGFTGISAALELAQAGLDVAVIEGHQIGNGGSGRNGGHLLPDWPGSFHHIEKHLSGEDADLAWQIGMDTVKLALSRIEKHKIDCDLTLGYVHAAYHKTHDRELQEMMESYDKRGIGGLSYLGGHSDIQQHIGTNAYISGIYDTNAGHIQPLKYLQGLAMAAQAAGADIHQNQIVTKIDPEDATLTTKSGKIFQGRELLICGNAYMGQLLPKKMGKKLAQVTSSVLATKPLSDNLANSLMPSRTAASDCNAALNYYRIDKQNRMIFGGRASYMIPDNPAIIGRDLKGRMTSVFPELADTDIETIWSGRIGITVSRIPQFGKLSARCRFVQGFSGHGVALTGMAGKILADDIIGDSIAFNTVSRIGHITFPGGPLRTPILALGMAYYKLRDRLKI